MPQTWRQANRPIALASLIQFTVPGAPTVYYGDEVGITGDDDPDDRRTYPVGRSRRYSRSGTVHPLPDT